MAKLILSTEGEVLREYPLQKDIMTIGRQSDNDIHIDSTSISGYHTRLVRIGNEIFLEDLGSTNGTYVNAEKVNKCILENDDVVTTGTHHFKLVEHDTDHQEHNDSVEGPHLRVIDGEHSNQTIRLNGGITTLGNPGQHIAAVTKRDNAYYFLHVDGGTEKIKTLLNGEKINTDGAALKTHDVLEVAGTKMEFMN